MASKLKPLIAKGCPFKIKELPVPFTWSQSKLKAFRRCERYFFWRFIMLLRPKAQPIPLRIGNYWHDGTAEWYESSRPADMRHITKSLLASAEKEIKRDKPFYDQDDFVELQAALTALGGALLGFSRKYKDDFKRWPKAERQVEIPFKVGFDDFDFTGRIDMLVPGKGKGRTTVVERKTAGRIGESYIDRLQLDTQVRSYVFGASVGLGLSVKDVIYDVVRKCKLRRKKGESVDAYLDRIAKDYEARPDFYFWREPLKFPASAIAAFEEELIGTHARLMFIVENFRWREALTWTPNDMSCTSMGRCPYMALCTTQLDRGSAHGFQQHDYSKQEK